MTYNDVSNDVYAHLKKDIAKSVSQWLETLLDNDYKVMIYRLMLNSLRYFGAI